MATTPPREHRVRAYWRANLRLVIALLLVWAACGLGLSIVFVEPLNRVRVFGFPLGFWFAQQGAILVFIALVLVYAAVMDRLDRRLLENGRGRDGDRSGGAG